jgi:hypothetical protein
MTDKMPFSSLLAKLQNLCLCLLNAIFSKVGNPGCYRRPHRVNRVGLADCNDPDFIQIAT